MFALWWFGFGLGICLYLICLMCCSLRWFVFGVLDCWFWWDWWYCYAGGFCGVLVVGLMVVCFALLIGFSLGAGV